MSETTAIKVGDEVTWMQVTTRGTGMNFSTKEGKVKALFPSVATVQMRNGRTRDVFLSDLRPINAKNHVTELFEKLCGRTESEVPA